MYKTWRGKKKKKNELGEGGEQRKKKKKLGENYRCVVFKQAMGFGEKSPSNRAL